MRTRAYHSLVALAFLVGLAFGPRTLASVDEPIEVRTADGVSLDGTYRQPDAPSALAVLLVHGFAVDHRSLDPLGRELAQRGYGTLALDMRDHGCCVHTAAFEDTLADLDAGVEFLKSRGTERIALIGHSLGGNRVAYYQAVRQEETVAAVVLLASMGNAYERGVAVGGAPALQALVQATERVNEGDIDGDLVPVPLGPLGRHSFSPLSLLSNGGPGTRSDHLMWVPLLETPLLIVHGLDDRLVPPSQSELAQMAAERSPRADLVLIPGAGHSFGSQTELADLIDSWLGDVLR